MLLPAGTAGTDVEISDRPSVRHDGGTGVTIPACSVVFNCLDAQTGADPCANDGGLNHDIYGAVIDEKESERAGFAGPLAVLTR